MLDQPLLLLGLVAVTVGAAAVHSALGFGSGPLLVPALLLAFDPAVAVLSAVLVGMMVNVLQLATEAGRPHVRMRRLAPLWLAAPVGSVMGALIAKEMAETALAVVVATALILSAATLFRAPSAGARIPPWGMACAGAAIGASAALTGIFGPLLGVVLVAAGEQGRPLRDGLGASFVVVGTVTVVASLIVSAPWSAFAIAGMLALPAAIGYLLGRRGARWLEPVKQRRAVLLAVLTGAAVSLARAV